MRLVKLVTYLVALESLSKEILTRDKVEYLETGSLHASIIKGGEEVSSYPAECRISIERRTVPGETHEFVTEEIRTVLNHLVATVPDFNYTLVEGLARRPLQVSIEHELVKSVEKHFKAHTGKSVEIRGEWYWTDAALMTDAGIPSVLFGVDGEGAHAQLEWATESSVYTVTDVIESIVVEWCNQE